MSALVGHLRAGRSQAESRMTETVRFFTREKSFPPGAIDPVWSDVDLFTGVKARVKFPSTSVSDRESASQLVVSQSIEVHVPVGSVPGVGADVLCEVTASAVDDGLTGQRFRVAGIPQSGQVTAWRFPVEVVS